MEREAWLNGWPRLDTEVVIGNGVHCVGCGKFHGVCTVAIEEDAVYPEKQPDWPFDEATCPLCLVMKASYVPPKVLSPNRFPK